MYKSSAHTIAPLDGVRGLAILLVLYCHVAVQNVLAEPHGSFRLVGTFGFSGVFLFFVLSGFLLFLPYARSLLAGSPWPSVKQFYLRRCLRILPVYWSALAALCALYFWAGHFSAPILSLAALILLLFNRYPAAAGLADTLTPPFWTLTIEWEFYLMLPWIALGVAKLASSSTGRQIAARLVNGLGLLIISGLLLRWLAAFAHYSTGLDNPAEAPGLLGWVLTVFYGSRGQELDVFALGMGIALLYVWGIEQSHLLPGHQRLIGVVAGMLALVGLGFSFWWAVYAGRVQTLSTVYFPHGEVWAVLGEWTLGLSFAFLLIAVLCGQSLLVAAFSWSPLRFIGTISYSLYVWHWLLFQVFANSLAAHLQNAYPWYVLLMLLTTGAFCSASYYLIERPFLRVRHATTKMTVALQPTSS